MRVEEVIEEVKKDGLLYRNSGGGITLSGGEPTYQPNFAEALLKWCHELMFHTCIETCGLTKWAVLEMLLPHLDLVLYDIKHLDSAKHKELTGIGNELILENAEKIVQYGKPLIARVPLIAGCNDAAENIKALARFVRELGIAELDLLPYHELGRKKYDSLGQGYKLVDTPRFSKDRVEEIRAALESTVGRRCSVKIV